MTCLACHNYVIHYRYAYFIFSILTSHIYHVTVTDCATSCLSLVSLSLPAKDTSCMSYSQTVSQSEILTGSLSYCTSVNQQVTLNKYSYIISAKIILMTVQCTNILSLSKQYAKNLPYDIVLNL